MESKALSARSSSNKDKDKYHLQELLINIKHGDWKGVVTLAHEYNIPVIGKLISDYMYSGLSKMDVLNYLITTVFKCQQHLRDYDPPDINFLNKIIEEYVFSDDFIFSSKKCIDNYYTYCKQIRIFNSEKMLTHIRYFRDELLGDVYACIADYCLFIDVENYDIKQIHNFATIAHEYKHEKGNLLVGICLLYQNNSDCISYLEKAYNNDNFKKESAPYIAEFYLRSEINNDKVIQYINESIKNNFYTRFSNEESFTFYRSLCYLNGIYGAKFDAEKADSGEWDETFVKSPTEENDICPYFYHIREYYLHLSPYSSVLLKRFQSSLNPLCKLMVVWMSYMQNKPIDEYLINDLLESPAKKFLIPIVSDLFHEETEPYKKYNTSYCTDIRKIDAEIGYIESIGDARRFKEYEMALGHLPPDFDPYRVYYAGYNYYVYVKQCPVIAYKYLNDGIRRGSRLCIAHKMRTLLDKELCNTEGKYVLPCIFKEEEYYKIALFDSGVRLRLIMFNVVCPINYSASELKKISSLCDPFLSSDNWNSQSKIRDTRRRVYLSNYLIGDCIARGLQHGITIMPHILVHMLNTQLVKVTLDMFKLTHVQTDRSSHKTEQRYNISSSLHDILQLILVGTINTKEIYDNGNFMESYTNLKKWENIAELEELKNCMEAYGLMFPKQSKKVLPKLKKIYYLNEEKSDRCITIGVYDGMTVYYPRNNQYGDICAICLREWCDGDTIAYYDCNHYFHEDCSNEWNGSCPMCRTDGKIYSGEIKFV